jgi:hypothetical protein
LFKEFAIVIRFSEFPQWVFTAFALHGSRSNLSTFVILKIN